MLLKTKKNFSFIWQIYFLTSINSNERDFSLNWLIVDAVSREYSDPHIAL